MKILVLLALLMKATTSVDKNVEFLRPQDTLLLNYPTVNFKTSDNLMSAYIGVFRAKNIFLDAIKLPVSDQLTSRTVVSTYIKGLLIIVAYTENDLVFYKYSMLFAETTLVKSYTLNSFSKEMVGYKVASLRVLDEFYFLEIFKEKTRKIYRFEYGYSTKDNDFVPTQINLVYEFEEVCDVSHSIAEHNYFARYCENKAETSFIFCLKVGFVCHNIIDKISKFPIRRALPSSNRNQIYIWDTNSIFMFDITNGSKVNMAKMELDDIFTGRSHTVLYGITKERYFGFITPIGHEPLFRIPVGSSSCYLVTYHPKHLFLSCKVDNGVFARSVEDKLSEFHPHAELQSFSFEYSLSLPKYQILSFRDKFNYFKVLEAQPPVLSLKYNLTVKSEPCTHYLKGCVLGWIDIRGENRLLIFVLQTERDAPLTRIKPMQKIYFQFSSRKNWQRLSEYVHGHITDLNFVSNNGSTEQKLDGQFYKINLVTTPIVTFESRWINRKIYMRQFVVVNDVLMFVVAFLSSSTNEMQVCITQFSLNLESETNLVTINFETNPSEVITAGAFYQDIWILFKSDKKFGLCIIRTDKCKETIFVAESLEGYELINTRTAQNEFVLFFKKILSNSVISILMIASEDFQSFTQKEYLMYTSPSPAPKFEIEAIVQSQTTFFSVINAKTISILMLTSNGFVDIVHTDTKKGLYLSDTKLVVFDFDEKKLTMIDINTFQVIDRKIIFMGTMSKPKKSIHLQMISDFIVFTSKKENTSFYFAMRVEETKINSFTIHHQVEAEPEQSYECSNDECFYVTYETYGYGINKKITYIPGYYAIRYELSLDSQESGQKVSNIKDNLLFTFFLIFNKNTDLQILEKIEVSIADIFIIDSQLSPTNFYADESSIDLLDYYIGGSIFSFSLRAISPTPPGINANLSLFFEPIGVTINNETLKSFKIDVSSIIDEGRYLIGLKNMDVIFATITDNHIECQAHLKMVYPENITPTGCVQFEYSSRVIYVRCGLTIFIGYLTVDLFALTECSNLKVILSVAKFKDETIPKALSQLFICSHFAYGLTEAALKIMYFSPVTSSYVLVSNLFDYANLGPIRSFKAKFGHFTAVFFTFQEGVVLIVHDAYNVGSGISIDFKGPAQVFFSTGSVLRLLIAYQGKMEITEFKVRNMYPEATTIIFPFQIFQNFIIINAIFAQNFLILISKDKKSNVTYLTAHASDVRIKAYLEYEIINNVENIIVSEGEQTGHLILASPQNFATCVKINFGYKLKLSNFSHDTSFDIVSFNPFFIHTHKMLVTRDRFEAPIQFIISSVRSLLKELAATGIIVVCSALFIYRQDFGN